MATTSITKKLKEDLQKDISKLLGRGLKALPCPLGIHDQARLWHNTLPIEAVTALHQLDALKYPTSSLTTWNVKFLTEIDDVRYTVQLVNTQRLFLDAPLVEGEVDLYERTEAQLKAAFPGAGGWGVFAEWIRNCAIIEFEFKPGIKTLADILGFSSTVGQLVRAVPDLHKYLPGDRQALLRDQARASNMPYGWGAFDRSRVDALQYAMAKASLMPKQDDEWDSIYVSGAQFV